MAVKTQTIDSWLTTHANHRPSHPALHFAGKTYSYQQLAERVNSLAIGLHGDLGLRRGDRIAFYGHNIDVEEAKRRSDDSGGDGMERSHECSHA